MNTDQHPLVHKKIKDNNHSMVRIQNIQLLRCKEDLARIPESKLLINTINAHSYNTARKDNVFTEALLKGLLIPDGIGVVLAVKLLRGERIERITGWDLFCFEMDRLESRHTKLKHKGKVFFLGSSESVLSKIKSKAAVDYPHLNIYTYSPPYKPTFSDADNREMIDAINEVEPDLLWVGMTAPKQEKWAHAHIDTINVHGHIGTIGAVFDFYAGTIKRAPVWWQEHGLEWLYRLVQEPNRMWKRYIVGNIKFLGYILNEKINLFNDYKDSDEKEDI